MSCYRLRYVANHVRVAAGPNALQHKQNVRVLANRGKHRRKHAESLSENAACVVCSAQAAAANRTGEGDLYTIYATQSIAGCNALRQPSYRRSPPAKHTRINTPHATRIRESCVSVACVYAYIYISVIVDPIICLHIRAGARGA